MTYAARVDFDPFDQQFLRDSLPYWNRVQAQGPVFYAEPFDFWVIASYEGIREALKDYETFSSQAVGFVPPPPELEAGVPKDLFARNSIIAMDPPDHGPTRKAVAKLFTPARAKELQGSLRAVADELVDGFERRGECDLMNEYCLPLSLHGIVSLLGLPPADSPLFLQWSQDHMALLAPREKERDGGGDAPKYHVSEEERLERWSRLREALRYYGREIADRRENPRDDGLTDLVLAESMGGDEDLSTQRVMLRCQELVAAGHDTTANLLAMLVLFLGESPAEMQRLRDDPSLIQNGIEEALRRHGTVTGLFRVTTRDTPIGDVTIPAGSMVFLPLQAAGNDASKFHCPEKFDASRDDAREHISFGAGPHLCVGAGTARLESRIGLEVLLKRLPGLRVKPDQDLEFGPNFSTSALTRLDVTWPARP